MFDFEKLQQTVSDELTKRAAETVQSPETQRQAMQKINEYGHTEPDQSAEKYNTAGTYDQDNEDMHNRVRRQNKTSSNIDDVEYHDDEGRQRVSFSTDKPYTRPRHKRPADLRGGTR